ncbi:hypothetical protein SAMN05428947_104181 [Mucilaginibacter sp. OK283]|nr:hypothetical protein SAMN05428947_104181 [Mucilaginibacter sp. OK283]
MSLFNVPKRSLFHPPPPQGFIFGFYCVINHVLNRDSKVCKCTAMIYEPLTMNLFYFCLLNFELFYYICASFKDYRR